MKNFKFYQSDKSFDRNEVKILVRFGRCPFIIFLLSGSGYISVPIAEEILTKLETIDSRFLYIMVEHYVFFGFSDIEVKERGENFREINNRIENMINSDKSENMKKLLRDTKCFSAEAHLIKEYL